MPTLLLPNLQNLERAPREKMSMFSCRATKAKKLIIPSAWSCWFSALWSGATIPFLYHVSSTSKRSIYIPSWPGFNIKIHNWYIIMESTSMHYLPSLDGPPTEHSIIMKVMKKTLQMEESLSGISSRIVCVFDQSVFAKAAGIKWRDPSK